MKSADLTAPLTCFEMHLGLYVYLYKTFRDLMSWMKHKTDLGKTHFSIKGQAFFERPHVASPFYDRDFN